MSLQVPGSDSSALTTRYFGFGLSCGMKPHFMPVGKPAPPRPRRPESLTCSMIAAGSWPSALLQRAVAAAALVGLQRPAALVVPVVGEDGGQRVIEPSYLSAERALVGRRGRSPSSGSAADSCSGSPARPADSDCRWSLGRPAARAGSAGTSCRRGRGRVGRGPAALAGDPQADQAGRTGGRALVGQVVGEAGEHPLGLAPGAQPRAARGVDLRAGPQVVDELDGRLGGHVVHELPVDHHHRRVVAGGVALDVLEADGPASPSRRSVVSSLPTSRWSLSRRQDRVAAHHRAQRVGADADVVVADRPALVHRVEGRHAAHVGGRDLEDVGAGLDALAASPGPATRCTRCSIGSSAERVCG